MQHCCQDCSGADLAAAWNTLASRRVESGAGGEQTPCACSFNPEKKLFPWASKQQLGLETEVLETLHPVWLQAHLYSNPLGKVDRAIAAVAARKL